MDTEKQQAIMMALNVMLNRCPNFREVMIATKLDEESKKMISETTDIITRLAKRIYVVSKNVEGEWND